LWNAPLTLMGIPIALVFIPTSQGSRPVKAVDLESSAEYFNAMMNFRCVFAVAVVSLVMPMGRGGAGAAEPSVGTTALASTPKVEKSIQERIWDLPKLYENSDNSVIQSLALIGRYHGQYWAVHADQGQADGWENRRFFLGATAELFHHFKVQAQIKVSEDFDPFYDGLYDAYVKWTPSESFSLTVGQVDYLYSGLERSLSSTKIVTFERSLLANQLMPGELVGAVAEGRQEKLSYRAGIFSGSIEDEFTHFDGGFGAVAGLGYDLPLFFQKGNLHLDYLYNNGNEANNAFKPYDHVVSLWHQGQVGRLGLGLDLTWGHGLDGRPDVFGVTLLPTYVIGKDVLCKGDAFQAVLRYQFGISDGDNGLQLQRRYEREVTSGSGDHYQAVYLGMNYLLYGDRFKLMTGAEYSVMRDAAGDGGGFDGVTYLAGVRLYF
jgi:hypothetical protein